MQANLLPFPCPFWYLSTMMKSRLTIAGLVLGILLLAGLLIGFLIPRLSMRLSRPFYYNTATFLRSIKGVNQLVSVQYQMEKVVVLEDPPKGTFTQWVTGESRVILVASGVAKAGVDLAKLTEGDLKLSGTNLTIRLPKSEIIDVFLDEQRTQVVEHKTGFMRKFDAKLPQMARQQALDEIRRAAKYNGIQDEADARARISLKQLFEPLGVAVEFKEK
jgi:hypothetical protein